jgi:hypothetical protein
MKSPAPTARPVKNKKIDINVSGGKLTSDAGVLLLQQVDQKLRLTEQINTLIQDPRDPMLVAHQQRHLLAQRLYSIALGYEDVNDQQNLRRDSAMLAAVKNDTDEELPLGSPSTLSRLENRVTKKELADLSKLLVEFFLESHATPPKRIILDVDTTDDTIHGKQERGDFNGFYDSYCFLPLYFFCGDQLLWSQLRSSKTGGAYGMLAIFHYLVTRIKQEWPDVEIVLRGDAGFYSPRLLNYCDRHGYKYIIGFSSNAVLKKVSQSLVIASKLFFKDGGSQESFRLYGEYEYQAGSWDYASHILVKAE